MKKSVCFLLSAVFLSASVFAYETLPKPPSTTVTTDQDWWSWLMSMGKKPEYRQSTIHNGEKIWWKWDHNRKEWVRD
ncbi:MAG: hypothetical protein KC505_08725 [Myxococcales bacterium]|nr:hypothetical protein [Myxococcales bacterium]USN51399.1 MAG: hypothetical protein H6731_03040 [Myxococcales bacterium]